MIVNDATQGNGSAGGGSRHAEWLAAVGSVASVVGLVLAFGVPIAAPDDAAAATFRIRTNSFGRATQTFRSDRTAHPRRIFTQGLDLRAFQLLGEGDNRLSAVVNSRYTTDFTVPVGRQDEPLYADQWNDTALRLAYLNWRITDDVELRLGRQWSRGMLGTRDFDGAHLEMRPRLDTETRGVFAGYAGREVEVGAAPFNTDDFDVQGLPATNEDAPVAPAADSKAWIAGGRVGLDWGERAAVRIGYRKRWRRTPALTVDSTVPRTGSERLGIAASAIPHRRLTFSAAAVYHATLDAVDRATLDVTWNLPEPVGTLSTGLEHRRPWFDASSIFNLFGVRPHQGAHAVYQQGVPALNSEFELRHWARIYRGDARSTGFRRTPRKTTRLGAAASHSSEVVPFGHSMDWNSQVSVEADTRGEESTHVLADTRLRSPIWLEDFYVTGQLLFLATTSHAASSRSGMALTYVLDLEMPVRELGSFRLTAERTSGTFHRPTTNLFATLELEIWR